MAFDILAGFNHVQQQGEMGRQRGEQTFTNRLLGQAYNSQGEERQSALAKLGATQPGVAMQAEDQFAARDASRSDNRTKRLIEQAKLLVATPEAMRGGVYAQMLPQLREMGIQAPDTPDATVWQMAERLASMGGQGERNTVRSSFVGEDGNMYSIMADGTVKPQGIGADRKLQAFDVPGVGPQVVDLRNATARTVTAGGGAPAPQSRPAQGYATAQMESGQADPSMAALPEAEQIKASQFAAAGMPFHIAGGKVVAGESSGLRQPTNQPATNRPPTLDRMPLSEIGGGAIGAPAWVRPAAGAADKPDAIERRIQLAREMGASPEDVRRMVLGRDAAAGGSKPMPASVLKMRESTVAEAETANTINLSIDKHLGRIQGGKLKFGPVQNLLSQGRNAINESTEESRNFAEFKADLEKLRNDSLRLNAGVQTDGDAKRAWDELIANINDGEYVKQRLETIRGLNERAALLKQESVERIDAEYGKSEQPVSGGQSGGPTTRLRYNPATGDFE